MNDILKNHFFWKYVVKYTTIFNSSTVVLYNGVKTVVTYTYAALLIIIFIHLFNVEQVANSKLVDPLWPMFFLKQDYLFFTTFFLQINLLLSVILVLFKNTQFLRVYIFIIYFLYAALINSFGKINHGLHFILIVLFCFALMPSRSRIQFEEKTILVYLSAKFFLLIAYTLTGFWKLFWGVIELFTQNVSMFSPLSFRNTLILQYEVKPITFFGDWFMEHYVIGWFLYLIVMYLECFAIFIFFKPNLYKVWGAGIILMNLGLALILNVNNYIAVFTIIFLLIFSPFNQITSLRQTLASLPIIDWFVFFYERKVKS